MIPREEWQQLFDMNPSIAINTMYSELLKKDKELVNKDKLVRSWYRMYSEQGIKYRRQITRLKEKNGELYRRINELGG